MSRILPCVLIFEGCFPRVSGDEPFAYYTGPREIVFSPRERG